MTPVGPDAMENAVVELEGPLPPAPRPWYRRRALWAPACIAVMISVIVMLLGARKRSAIIHPSSSTDGFAVPSDVVQVGLVNIFSQPEVYRPVVAGSRNPRERQMSHPDLGTA